MPSGLRKSFTLEIPYPPSVNHYWRRVGARTLISEAGRRYREVLGHVISESGVEGFGSARVLVRLTFYHPNKQRRDIDNLAKPILDGLEAWGVFENDSQVDDLRLRRGGVEPPIGRVIVEIEEC